MTTWAVSQFKNETDVLEIRLGTIADLVDRIVLAEATVDQRGRPRELVYPKHAERYAQWADKIEYVVVDDMPKGTSHEDDVKRERWQRDALLRGMPDLQRKDLVYVSDLDEIPYPDSLRMALDGGKRVRFPMDMFPMALNWRWRDRGCRIGSISCVVYGGDILDKGVCHAALWDNRVQGLEGVHGHHLTYQGGADVIREKILGMMDKYPALCMPGTDPDRILEPGWMEECIATGRDMFGRVYRESDWVGLDAMPSYVQANAEKFAHMMVPRPANQDEIEAQPRCDCGGSGFSSTGNEVLHFPYCELAPTLPDNLIHGTDNRARPRSLDV